MSKYIRATWGSRKLNKNEASVLLRDFFYRLVEIDPENYNSWHAGGDSLKEALEKKVDIEDVKQIEEEMSMSKYQNSVTYYGGLWNGEISNALAFSMDWRLGDSHQLAKNYIFLKFPRDTSRLERKYTLIELIEKIKKAMQEVFNPDEIVVSME